MTDGGQDFDLGQVVGSAGEKGDDGSTVWNTSTAPTYANSKYTFNISNLSGKTGLEIAVNDIIFYSTYYYIVSAVNTTTVDCSTRVSIKGSDATVTIATSFGSTPSDSKVPSEKLTKNTLDGKAPTSHASSSSTYGLGTTANYGHVKTINGLTQSSHSDGTALSAYQGKVLKDAIDAKPDSSDIPTKTSDLTNDSNYISTSSTSGLIKNDGTIDTTSYSTFSGSYNDLSNKPTLFSGSYADLSNKPSYTATVTSSTVGAYEIGKINVSGSSQTIYGKDTGGTSVDIVTQWESTPSDSKVASEKLTKNTIDGKLDNALSSTTVTVASDDNILITDYSDSNKIKRVENILASQVKDGNIHSNISTLANSSQAVINNAIDMAIGDKVSKSSTSGLLKNDGSVDTTSYSTFSGSYNDLSGKPTIPSASTTTPSADTTSGSYGSGTNYARSNHTHPKSSLYAEATHSHTKSQITDFPTIPTKTSDLTNDGADGTNVFVANNDSRLSDARTPTSHAHGNLTHDGKVGSTANYFVYTTTSGAITSKQKIGNITTSGAIGSTSGLPIITSTSGVLTTGSFGTTSGTFAEGNHTHSAYVNPTKVTSWSSTPSDDNVASEKLIKDSLDAKQATLVSGTNLKTINNNSLLGSGNINIEGGGGSGGSYINDFYGDSSTNELVIDYDTGVSQADIVTSWNSTPSDDDVPSEKLTKDTLDGKASSSHTHGNISSDGKVGSNSGYFVTTTTSGAVTSQQKIGNIDTSGKIGTTSGKPIITTTGGTLSAGSFGTSSGTFAEGNHTHNYSSINNVSTVDVVVTYTDSTTETIKLLKYTGS